MGIPGWTLSECDRLLISFTKVHHVNVDIILKYVGFFFPHLSVLCIQYPCICSCLL